MSSDQLPDLQQLEQLLQQMLQPDTNVIRQTGEILNKLLKKSALMPLLLELLQQSQIEGVRQLSAVLLRKKIVGHWGNLPTVVQENFKAILLEILVRDPSNLVRLNTGNVIGAIARLLIPVGQWQELLDFLRQCAQSQSVEHREVAMGLFEKLTETIGDHLMKNHFAALLHVFATGLQDQDHHIRVASLKAAGSVVAHLTTNEEIKMFAQLLPSIIQVIKYCITNGFDDEAISAFEIFDDLIEIPKSIISTMVPNLVQFVLEVGATNTVDLNVRQKALTFIEWVASHKPKSLIKYKLVQPILQVIFPMCAEPDNEEADLTAHAFASQMVDLLSRKLPTKHFYTPAMEFVSAYAADPSPDRRRAAVIALAVLAEGSAEEMNKPDILPQLLNVIYAGFKDANQGVREASCLALGQFAKYLQPEIIEHYNNVLPHLLQSLSDPTEKVRMSSLLAIETFCENLDEEILPFLDPLMNHLVELLKAGPPTISEIALSSISSVADAAGKAFLPYYQTIITLVNELMSSFNPATMPLRIRATECAGIVATAVGKETFQPVLKTFMDYAFKGLESDFTELRESTFLFFGNIAEVLKEEFVEYMPYVIPHLTKSMESTEGIVIHEEEEQQVEGIEEDEDEGGIVNASVHTDFLDEKAASCEAIGFIAEYTGAHFLPYLDSTFKIMNDLSSYFHEDVRQAAMMSLKRLAVVVNAANPPKEPWKPGVGSEQQPLNPAVQQFVDLVFPIWINAIKTDTDKPVVTSACQALGDTVKLLGPASIEKSLPETMNSLINLLNKKTFCQTLANDEEGEEQQEQDQVEFGEEDDEDEEMTLMESACDCIVDIAKAIGEHTEPYYKELYAPLSKYAHSGFDGYRALGIGTFAELSAAMGDAIGPYVQNVIGEAFKGMEDEDLHVQNNSTFYLGVLLQNGGQFALPYYPQALAAVAKIFEKKPPLENLIDNACAAMARMIMTAPNHVPLEQVIPVVLRELPLKSDFEEAKTVYGCLCALLKQSNPTLGQHLPQVINIFSLVIGSKDVEELVQFEMVVLLKGLLAQYPQHVGAIIEALPPAQSENLKKFLSA